MATAAPCVGENAWRLSIWALCDARMTYLIGPAEAGFKCRSVFSECAERIVLSTIL